MTQETRFGGRCEKHLCPKPCSKCAEVLKPAMKMPTPIKTYPKSKSGPSISVYSEDQLKQAVRDSRNQALDSVKLALMTEPTLLLSKWKIAEIVESLKDKP